MMKQSTTSKGMVTDLKQLRKRLQVKRAEFDFAKRTFADETDKLEVVKKRERDVLEAQGIAQQVAETVQNTAHARIASVVTSCLRAVFGETAYEFRINFRSARGKTEAVLVFVRDGQEIDPMDSAGGGVVDVASFALRLACLMLSLPRKRRLLVLDESFRFVSREYRPLVKELLLKLAGEMDCQFILITHSPELVCGNVIEIGEVG